jgi:1,2-diacylglycerol 3-beta-galactosyltransferase
MLNHQFLPMAELPSKPPHILFLFSDTGGGHRSATEAIIEALKLEFDAQVTTQMVDIFLDIAPQPLNHLPKWYPYMVRLPEVWGFSYRISNGTRRARVIVESAYPYVRRSLHRVIRQNPADMIVSLHPLANDPFLHALGKHRPPFITVVTDLVTMHALWFHKATDLTFVPTAEAYQRALQAGLNPEQVKIVGLPVADRFCQPVGDPIALREKLCWPQEHPVVLLVGGGEGMGPIEKAAVAIADANLPITLVIVAGRNQELKQRLEAHPWPMKTLIYGFVHEMPDFMRASNILVTKAGPGTISEALNAGLPMILYSRLPGQEDGNVDYVISEGVGVWAPKTSYIVSAIKAWITHPRQLEVAAEACCQAARPEAARQIARALANRLGIYS